MCVCVLYSAPFAQNTTEPTEKNPLLFRLETTKILGYQIFNDTFTYNPGIGFAFIGNAEISPSFLFGGGCGYMQLKNERFLPIFIDLKSYKQNSDNLIYLSIQGGYSFGWNQAITNIQGYDFSGGIFVGFGIGKTISIHQKAELSIQLSYRHQFAIMKYSIINTALPADVLMLNPNVSNYTKYNYDMIAISAALTFL